MHPTVPGRCWKVAVAVLLGVLQVPAGDRPESLPRVPSVWQVLPAEGVPGTWVKLRGEHLDQVRAVLLGNRRVTSFAASRPGNSLAFLVPREWDPTFKMAFPVVLRYLGGKAGTLERVVLDETFTVLPRHGEEPEPGKAKEGMPEEKKEVKESKAEGKTESKAAAGVPELLSLTPGQAAPGDTVVLEGRHLEAVSGIRILRKVAVPLAEGRTSTRLAFQVPFYNFPGEVQSQVMALTGPAGAAKEVASTLRLRLLPPRPGVAQVLPARGCPGSLVVIRGDNLDRVTQVRFGSGATSEFLKTRPGEVRMRLPAGASTGDVVVTTVGGTARALAPYTVLDPGDPVALSLAGLQVTQATQRMDGSVPLVQGREACVRVFLVAGAGNLAQPRVRVTVRDDQGEALLEQEVAGTGYGVPTFPDPDAASSTWNLMLPGELVQPGNGVAAQLVEAGAGAPAAGHRFPPDGGVVPMRVRAVPTLRLTLVPVRTRNGVGRVVGAGRTLESWAKGLRKLFPLRDIDLELGEEFPFEEDLGDPTAALEELNRRLETKRLLDDPWNLRFYYGVIPALPPGQITGLANIDKQFGNFGRTACGWDRGGGGDPEAHQVTLAHELGHLLGLDHAPTPRADRPDSRYPVPNGRLDTAGFDPDTQTAKAPGEHIDFMGYGERAWVSAYTWEKLLDRLGRELREGRPEPAAPASHLLITGRILRGVVDFEPAFELAGDAAEPEPGRFRLACLDARGRSLAQFPFTAPALGEDRTNRRFAFQVPMTETLRHRLHGFQVLDRGRPLKLVQTWNRQPAGGAPPQAEAWVDPGTGELQLAWDTQRYPGALVRDADSGATLGILDGSHRTCPGRGARELEVRLSDGVRTTVVRVTVQGAARE